MFTSRSAVETYHDCPFLRYNKYHRGGKGLVGAAKSVPLVTGSAVHRGVEHLLNRLRIGEPEDVDTAVGLALETYTLDCETAGFRGRDLKGDRQQWHTFNEQRALAAALIRAWHLREFPRIKERYKVLAVEREIEPIEIAPGVMWMAKVDAEFQDLETKDYVNYSLKTTKEWNERMEESYKSDLQGITEIWSVEEDWRRRQNRVRSIIEQVEMLNDPPKKAYLDIKKFMEGQKVDKRISAIRFCYLVKGAWKKIEYGDEETLRITYSPLIRGYKNVQPNGIAFAHSWFYPNSENRSGKSVLGKGWEPFFVWEQMGVKEWVGMLDAGEVQPICGDILKAQVVTPVEYFRDEHEIEEGMKEVQLQEHRIQMALLHVGIKTEDDYSDSCLGERTLREVFPKNRKHCYWAYGDKCEYLDLCFKPEIAEDPISGSLYQIRIPHHESEKT